MKLVNFIAAESTGFETILINPDKIIGLLAVRDRITDVPTGEAVLVLDNGNTIPLDDSFDEAKARLRSCGYNIDERVLVHVQYEPY